MGCGCGNKKTNNTTKNKPTLVENFNPPIATTVPTSKMKKPSLLKKVFNFSNALANHVVDGLSKATNQEFSKRIEICLRCPFRNDDKCSKCGCFIQTKAAWKTSECPDGRWVKLKDK